MIFLIVDFALNINAFTEGRWKVVLFDRDPFLFRVEFLLVIVSVVFIVLTQVVLLVLGLIRTFLPWIFWFRACIDFISEIWVVLVIPGFSLAVTIYWEIKRARRTRNVQSMRITIQNKKDKEIEAELLKIDFTKAESIQKGIVKLLLAYPPSYELFLNFAKSEFSVENVLIWNDLRYCYIIAKRIFVLKFFLLLCILQNLQLVATRSCKTSLHQTTLQLVLGNQCKHGGQCE